MGYGNSRYGGSSAITHTGDVTGGEALTIGSDVVEVSMIADGTDGELITWDASGEAVTLGAGTANMVLTSNGAGAAPTFQALPIELMFFASDQITSISTGDNKMILPLPFSMTLSAVRIDVITAPTGSGITFDIEEAGSTIFSTLPTIDATETSTSTAATPAVISDSTLTVAGSLKVNFDAVGSTIAGKGVSVTLTGTRA